MLTGTPLQNNVDELFSLLNFLEPAQFPSQVAFLMEFGDLKTEAQVEKLKQVCSHCNIYFINSFLCKLRESLGFLIFVLLLYDQFTKLRKLFFDFENKEKCCQLILCNDVEKEAMVIEM